MKYPIMKSNRKPLINAQEYESMYEQSMSQPDEFWADQADQFISWDKKWDKVSDVDFSKGKIAWFIDIFVAFQSVTLVTWIF